MNSTHDARFYFANLGADVARGASAALAHDDAGFENAVRQAHKTLNYILNTGRVEAYEEGLLLLCALKHARAQGTLERLSVLVNELVWQYSPIHIRQQG